MALRRIAADVMHHERPARLQEVGGHRTAHDAKTDESEPHCASLPDQIRRIFQGTAAAPCRKPVRSLRNAVRGKYWPIGTVGASWNAMRWIASISRSRSWSVVLRTHSRASAATSGSSYQPYQPRGPSAWT